MQRFSGRAVGFAAVVGGVIAIGGMAAVKPLVARPPVRASFAADAVMLPALPPALVRPSLRTASADRSRLRPDPRPASRSRALHAARPGPRAFARNLLLADGFGAGEWGCLSSLWQRESGWNVHATNPWSGAYGIPQALPGVKMAPFGSNWATSPYTQIRWGLAYIKLRYGTPCAAWDYEMSAGYY